MNIVKHRVYKLELDIWEPLQPDAEREIDALIGFIKARLRHSGNVKITLESEARQ